MVLVYLSVKSFWLGFRDWGLGFEACLLRRGFG